MIFKKDGSIITQLSWTPPSTREDGTAYSGPDHGGYNVYVNGESFVSIPNDFNITSWPVDQLGIVSTGTNTIQLSTVDSSGRESVLSSPIVIEVEIARPKPPTGLSVS